MRSKSLTNKPKLKGSIDKDVLLLSNRFYSAIPQTMEHRPKSGEGKVAMDEWLRKMALNNEKILDEKEELLDLLSDVQGMVGGFATTDVAKKYVEIGCQYDEVPNSDPAYERVQKYYDASHSRHHTWKSTFVRLWRVSIKGQKDKHLPAMRDIGNIDPSSTAPVPRTSWACASTACS